MDDGRKGGEGSGVRWICPRQTWGGHEGHHPHNADGGDRHLPPAHAPLRATATTTTATRGGVRRSPWTVMADAAAVTVDLNLARRVWAVVLARNNNHDGNGEGGNPPVPR